MVYKDNYETWRSWGEALRIRRTVRGMSQTKLSELTGIGYTSISQYECNGRAMTVLRAYTIAEALKWTLEEWKQLADEVEREGTWKRQNRKWKHNGNDS